MTPATRIASLAAFSVILLTACGVESEDGDVYDYDDLAELEALAIDDADARFEVGDGIFTDAELYGIGTTITEIGELEDLFEEEEIDPDRQRGCVESVSKYEQAVGATDMALDVTEEMAAAGFEMNVELDERVQAVWTSLESMEPMARAAGHGQQDDLDPLQVMIESSWNSADFAYRHAEVMAAMSVDPAVRVAAEMNMAMIQLDEMSLLIEMCMGW